MRGYVVKSFQVHIIEAALKRSFVTSLGCKTHTCNVAFILRLHNGALGYGEASASLALAHLRPETLAATLKALGRQAVGKDARDARLLIEAAWKRHPGQSPAVSAFECALLGSLMQSSQTTLSSWLGGKLQAVESDITLSAWDNPSLTKQAAEEASKEGFRQFKIKVGEDFNADMARVRTSVRAARPKPRIILDGNQGMTVKGALRLVEACLKENIAVDLLEQPLSKTDFKNMAALTRRSPIPVAADEMVMSPAEAVRVADQRAANVINIKAAKSGILRSLEIAAVARAAGLDLMIGCMAETARGLAPSVHLALGTGFFRFVDLDSDHLLARTGSSLASHLWPTGQGRLDWTRSGPRLSGR